MTLNDIFLRLCDIDRRTCRLLDDAGFNCEDGLCDSVCRDPSDPEERFRKDILESLLLPFGTMHEELSYLRSPVSGEYRLERFPDGRYGYSDGQGIRHMFTCGSPIEARILDDQGCPLWIRTRFEHDGNDYYLWHHGSVPLTGLTVRERGRSL